MAYSVRYQVFLSSTFTDLKEERAEVIQALWELDCVPTGMEAFLASNMSQWEVIQRVIDECDYYVLIIGGRYGSVTDEGISYTEKEFNYAQKIGLPILAFVHGAPEKIELGKSESDSSLREKLETFRARVMEDYPISEWTTAHQLGGLVSRSLVKAIKVHPRPGWIRNDGSSPVALLERIDVLSQENAALKALADDKPDGHIPIEELAGGDDKITLNGSVTLRRKTPYGRYDRAWSAETTWDILFRNVGPMLLNEESEDRLADLLRLFYQGDKDYPYKDEILESSIDTPSLAAVVVQLRALGLIDRGMKRRGVNDSNSYWRLTEYGDRYLVNLMARRKARGSPSDSSAEKKRA